MSSRRGTRRTDERAPIKRTGLPRKGSLLLHVGPELLNELSDDGSLGLVVVEALEVREEGGNSSFEASGEVGSDESSEFGT